MEELARQRILLSDAAALVFVVDLADPLSLAYCENALDFVPQLVNVREGQRPVPNFVIATKSEIEQEESTLEVGPPSGDLQRN